MLCYANLFSKSGPIIVKNKSQQIRGLAENKKIKKSGHFIWSLILLTIKIESRGGKGRREKVLYFTYACF